MKNIILKNLSEYKELDITDIINLPSKTFVNSSFKLNLINDAQKSQNFSNSKFYLSNGNLVIKFQYDDICKKLTLFFSQDTNNIEKLLFTIITLPFKKVETYLNSSFVNLKNLLENNNYIIEVVRKDKFLINNQYEDEVVMSFLKGDN